MLPAIAYSGYHQEAGSGYSITASQCLTLVTVMRLAVLQHCCQPIAYIVTVMKLAVVTALLPANCLRCYRHEAGSSYSIAAAANCLHCYRHEAGSSYSIAASQLLTLLPS